MEKNNNEYPEHQKPPSLLKKFNIPINHLDFNYIENCKNAEEIEKIVEILKSCEEGYYPDLTHCAVSKLMMMKPNSKILREEIPLITKHRMPTDDWNNLTNTINVIYEYLCILQNYIIILILYIIFNTFYISFINTTRNGPMKLKKKMIYYVKIKKLTTIIIIIF